MSTQIDIIRKRREPGQGSWVRIEEIGKAPTATLDDPILVLRGKRQSHTATWRKSPKNTEGKCSACCVRGQRIGDEDESEKSFCSRFPFFGVRRSWQSTARRRGVFPLQRANI